MGARGRRRGRCASGRGPHPRLGWAPGGHRHTATRKLLSRSAPPRVRFAPAAQQYLVVDVLDGPHEPIGRHFARVNAFVAAARAQGGTVLVHCHGGVSRAAALVLAFLIGREGLGFDDALAALRAARPVVDPNPGFVTQLRAFEASLGAGLPEADCDCGCGPAEGRLDPDTPEAEGEVCPLSRAAHGRGLPCSPTPPMLVPLPTSPPVRTSSTAARFSGGNTL